MVNKISALAAVIAIALVLAGVYIYNAGPTVKPGSKNTTAGINNITLPQYTPRTSHSKVDFGIAASYVNKSDLLVAKSYGIKFMRADVYFAPAFNSFMENATATGIFTINEESPSVIFMI